jgi:hypothetical protein
MLISRIPTPTLITTRHDFSESPMLFLKKENFPNFLRKPMFKKSTKHVTVPKHAKSQSVFDAM